MIDTATGKVVAVNNTGNKIDLGRPGCVLPKP